MTHYGPINTLRTAFFLTIVVTFFSSGLQAAPPYAQSPVISDISWEAESNIIRLAEGSDTFPITWADDDKLYTTFGDGWGFEPFTERKLSIGFSAVEGSPATDNVTGSNIRSSTGEQTGQGARGKKASGMLMVDGTLYMYVRNADQNGNPKWSANIDDRAPVFTHTGKVARTGIVYNAGLDRYLWWQMIPGDGDIRFRGGFAIYDAPEPWGPWTTAFYIDKWDTGPGETASFPTKWISDDGKIAYLVFSGDDYFSIRKATFTVNGNTVIDPPNIPTGLSITQQE